MSRKQNFPNRGPIGGVTNPKPIGPGPMCTGDPQQIIVANSQQAKVPAMPDPMPPVGTPGNVPVPNVFPD